MTFKSILEIIIMFLATFGLIVFAYDILKLIVRTFRKKGVEDA